jgi:peptidoglycan/LPS O-acetylase OafA/YrhL
MFGLFTWKTDWLFTNLVFYFVFGMVMSFHVDEVKAWLGRWRKVLLGGLILSLAPAVLETEWVYRTLGQDWRGGVFTLSAAIYAALFLLVYLAFYEIPVPNSRMIQLFGSKSYGLYLIHPIVLMLVSKILYHVAPFIFAYQVLYQPVLVAAGVFVPLLMMNLVSRTPLRPLYAYLFG